LSPPLTTLSQRSPSLLSRSSREPRQSSPHRYTPLPPPAPQAPLFTAS
jgi:hypothetical protein